MNNAKGISCLLVQAGGKTSRVSVNPDDFRDMARAISCDYIETATRFIANDEYVIICDEEGKLKGGNDVTIVTGDMLGRLCEVFVGDCLIARRGLRSLRECDFRKIEREIVPVQGKDGREINVLLCFANGITI